MFSNNKALREYIFLIYSISSIAHKVAHYLGDVLEGQIHKLPENLLANGSKFGHVQKQYVFHSISKAWLTMVNAW